MKATAMVLLPVMFLTGCDVAHSVNWTAQTATLPSLVCVERSLRAVPEITKVEAVTEGRSPIEFNYCGDYFCGSISGSEGPASPPQITISALWLNYVPSRAEIVANRDVFAKIFRSLKDHCTEAPPLSAVHESTFNIPPQYVPQKDPRIAG